MRISAHSLFLVVLTGLLSTTAAMAQKELVQSPRILLAKTVYFKNQTGSDAVGKNAVTDCIDYFTAP